MTAVSPTRHQRRAHAAALQAQRMSASRQLTKVLSDLVPSRTTDEGNANSSPAPALPCPVGSRVRYHRPIWLASVDGFGSGDGEGTFEGIYTDDFLYETCWEVRLDDGRVLVLYPEKSDTVEALA